MEKKREISYRTLKKRFSVILHNVLPSTVQNCLSYYVIIVVLRISVNWVSWMLYSNSLHVFFILYRRLNACRNQSDKTCSEVTIVNLKDSTNLLRKVQFLCDISFVRIPFRAYFQSIILHLSDALRVLKSNYFLYCTTRICLFLPYQGRSNSRS